MNNINVNLRLRPIRFGFLVRPNDKQRLQQIFKINTCLWGGQYNPIIPFFSRLPPWWEREGLRFENAKQVINGYLDFFEPDFIVEAENGLSDGLGFDEKRVLQLEDLLQEDGEREREKYGLSVNDLYIDLYESKYQFERRHQHNIVNVASSEKKYSCFVGCVFGDFPTDEKLKYFEENFCDAFDPEQIQLNAETLRDLYRNSYTSALKVGNAKVKVSFHDHSDPTLFILDATQSKDLIDFWNLRAVNRGVVAIPVQWIAELSDFCKEFILESFRPLPGNPNGVMIRPKSMFSRSIDNKKIDDIFDNYIRVDKDGANCVQTWYPPIWREPPEIMVRTMRPTLEAATKSIDVQVNDDNYRVRFEPLYPEFSSKYGNRVRWANVVRLRDWSITNQVATVFPCNYKTPSFPNFKIGREDLLSTTEGFVTFPEYRDLTESWDLYDGTSALNKWFKESGIKAIRSDAGKATQQIIRAMNGFGGVRALAHKDIVSLLNEMSRKPVAKSMHSKEFQNKVANAVAGDIWRNHTFESLIEAGAVELGMEIKCCNCETWSWYSVKELDYSLVCDLCLEDFKFPVANPGYTKLSRWAYRVVGPFALPDYSRGGYSAALAIRFFGDVIGRADSANITWSTGQELTLPTGKPSEADFILWYQRKQFFGNDYPTEVVFGEAKSFGKDAFKDDDVQKMKLLAQSFPGSILVFATMKEAEELSKDEVKRIKQLAEWGREYDKVRKQSRAPVIVLTGTELFTPIYLNTVWEDKGGKYAELIRPAYISSRLDNLRILADLTQQLYLSMPPYSKWQEKKWKIKYKKKLI